ncbi:hypothetical protein DFO77_11310 [Marinilabilia salmonicolor]|jgi:hypothetical protein|uniref:Uncharacterized protein n=1 Tax=Marinilabilia salmonicolor TaxID=989 RepID=A0A368UYU5_9BACT|nr:hypothetical protein DFO77_11310 [Marinilabilia salmonicolor]
MAIGAVSVQNVGFARPGIPKNAEFPIVNEYFSGMA